MHELVGMETRGGAHGQRRPLSETKEGEILSQDQKVPPTPFGQFQKHICGEKTWIELARGTDGE